MRCNGVFFALGMMAVGWVLFAFGAAHSIIAKSQNPAVRVIALERVGSQATNIAYNIQRAFRKSAGISLSLDDGKFTVSETLPNYLAEYGKQVRDITEVAELEFNATVAVNPEVRVLTDIGVNYTHSSDNSIQLTLPATTDAVALSGDTTGELNNCTAVCEPGSTSFIISLAGDGGACSKSCSLDINGTSSIIADDGRITLRIADGKMTLKSLDKTFHYVLSVRVNQSGHHQAPRIDGYVAVAASGVRKTGEVVFE
jgi:hypothetical protein